MLKDKLGQVVSYFTTNFKTQAVAEFKGQYDLAVIGGGSGGLAAAFEANKYGLKVIVIDYVEESLHKTKWGIGGTCVNVGCIPKKLMHEASKSHENILNSHDFGWELPNNVNNRYSTNLHLYFNWSKLKESIHNYIKSINFGYLASMRKNNMDYLNCLATFKDRHTLICSKDPELIKQYLTTGTIETTNQSANVYEINAKNILIATGTRPNYIPCIGSHLAITSDDIFYSEKPPGKTLVVGGGYVAVEIAGFLNGMGYEVSLATRGEYLRAFDRDMVNCILDDLKFRKVNLIETSLPLSLKETESKAIEVIMKNQITGDISTPEHYDTVLFAVGRTATTKWLNLDKVGVKVASNHKILGSKEEIERTNIDNIYAIGDVVDGLPELTSTAAKMGQYLARRIVHKLGKHTFPTHQMSISLENYPTTIFTPLEYSCCGMSEEQAIAKFGLDNIEVYHMRYVPLEENLLDKYNVETGESEKINVYAKAIVQKDNEKVLGLHYAGPNAGEVMQGYAVAMRIGLTKLQLDSTIGIHPTSAEELTNLTVTKSSNEDCSKTSC